MTDPNKSLDGDLHVNIEAIHHALLNRELLSPPEWHARIETLLQSGRTFLRAEWVRVKRGD